MDVWVVEGGLEGYLRRGKGMRGRKQVQVDRGAAAAGAGAGAVNLTS